MQRLTFFIFFLVLLITASAQTNTYKVSFDNAVHHEGVFELRFQDIKEDTLVLRMANSSPGRYAFHSFAKNVYNVKAEDGAGNTLKLDRPNPYQWNISGHNGEVTVTYTLFANRGDGTYSQIDETHAHLNIPASFMYAPNLRDRSIEVSFDIPNDSDWRVATQLKQKDSNTFWAPNLYYFMDSPIEISKHAIREFEVEDSNGKQKIRFVLHHKGTDQELDTYFEDVKAIVLHQKEVFGELPNFDYGEYTFLACYMPNVNGDGMEHRNSTILTSTRSLADGGLKRNSGTVSHEFFHAWNVERIRPKSLEPFDFDNVDMSGELWFAEGFTSYYTNLIRCRAGIITPEEYVKGLNGSFNYVWNSNGRKFHNPIEMSYQAPFVDAATSLDPQNRNNTFISYYSYGSVLGLALDLSLREKGLNLDDYFKKVWIEYGKPEKPYTIQNLHTALNQYAGEAFGNHFFNNFVYDSKMPDYKTLFNAVGINIIQKNEKGLFGARIKKNTLTQNTLIDSPAYKAGLEKGDIIMTVNGIDLSAENTFSDFIKELKSGTELNLTYKRYGISKEATLKLAENPSYSISIAENADDTAIAKRNSWLGQE